MRVGSTPTGLKIFSTQARRALVVPEGRSAERGEGHERKRHEEKRHEVKHRGERHEGESGERRGGARRSDGRKSATRGKSHEGERSRTMQRRAYSATREP